jgi:pimeloyl-ACP methyl ester carboxylesterase
MSEIRYGPETPDATYTDHRYDEHIFETGEIELNYATAGSTDNPSLLLVPGQMESWWGYEEAMEILSDDFQVFAVDLRGQGRSSRTPGRYTFDNFANDLVRFIAFGIGDPVVVSGHSSGGVVSAWLSAYAPPGMIRGALYEDPPLFACERNPSYGQSIQQALGDLFEAFNTHLGNQWRAGDWEGLVEELPAEVTHQLGIAGLEEPPDHIKEYDPEWGDAFVSGDVAAACNHEQMLLQVSCPVLLTHHFRTVNEATGHLNGAISDLQVDQAERLITDAGQPFTRRSFPEMGHNMHNEDPELFVRTLSEWVETLPRENETRREGVLDE